MRDIKKMVILFLISLVLVLGLSYVVSATVRPPQKNATFITYYDLGNITVSLADVNASFSGSYLGVQYLRNDTYQFNITVSNTNTVGNITRINITLPSQMSYIHGTESANTSTGVNFSESSNLKILTWNKSSVIGEGALINISGANSSYKFGFAANVSSGTQQKINLTIRVIANGSRDYWVYNLSNNITIDGAVPRTFTANTTGSSTVNITFPERMNVTAFFAGSFNGTVATTGKTVNISAVAIVGPSLATSTTVLIRINKSIKTNETPTIYAYSGGDGNLTDLAGNRFISGGSATATDGAAPGLEATGITYSYYNKTLALAFNETIDRTKLNCDNLYMTATNDLNRLRLSDTYCSSNSTDDQTNQGDRLSIVLSQSGREQISAWRDYLNVTINSSSTVLSIKDTSGNNIKSVIAGQRLNFVANDTTPPNITKIEYNLSNNKTIIITFNESMAWNASTSARGYNVTLANTSNLTGYLTDQGFIRLVTALHWSEGRNGTTMNITLTDDQRDKIENWSVVSLYLAWNESEFEDLAGNNVSGRHNSTGRNFTTYTYDSTAPKCYLTVTEGGATREQESGPTINITYGWNRTGIGLWNISILFNETMEVLDNISIAIQKVNTTTTIGVRLNLNETDDKAHNVKWYNTTMAAIYFNLTDSLGDGTGRIYIKANDIRGNTLSNTSCRDWVIDTTAPKVLAAYYVDKDDTDYRDVDGDEIVVIFSENVSVKKKNRGEGNFSFNISHVGSNKATMNATNATYSGGPIGRIKNGSMINITINGSTTTNITIRGVYTPTLNKFLNASGIDIKSGQTDIVDATGNPAVPNSSAVDIADTMWAFTQNATQVISTPYCINRTLMEGQLNSTTGACRYYTNSAWRTLTTGNYQPLVAYSCKFTSNVTLRLYTLLNQSCNLQDQQETLESGWSLVGLDTAYNQTAMSFLTSISADSTAAGGVSYYYTTTELSYTGANKLVVNSGTRFADTRVSPYVGYWLSLRDPPGATTWTFTGAGFY